MANLVYDSAKVDICKGDINLENDSFNVLLVNGYTADVAHDFRDHVTGACGASGDYPAAGFAVNLTVGLDAVNHRAKITIVDGGVTTSNQSVMNNTTITATGAVIYKNVGTAGTDRLLGFVDFGGTQISSNGKFEIDWNALGVLYVG